MRHPLSCLHGPGMSFSHSCQVKSGDESNFRTRGTNYQNNFDFRTHLNFLLVPEFDRWPKNFKDRKKKKDAINLCFRDWKLKKKKVLLTKTVKVSESSARLQAIKVRAGTVETLYVTAAHFARTTALHVPALLRFTHSSSTLNESANHPMHWTSQTILYLSSGCRRENNDSLTQVKEAMWLNQYFYYGPLHRRLPFECPVATFLRPLSSLSLKISNGSHNGRRRFYKAFNLTISANH